MKIGVISDVHGNIEALNKVLDEFEKRNVEKIICCGDIIGIGACPEEAVQRLIQIKDKLIAVRGNHEQYLLKGIPGDVHDEKRKIKEVEINNHKWTHSRLSDASVKFLKELPIEQNIEVEGKRIYIVHYPINKDETYKKHIQKANLAEIQELFDDKEADIYFYGHTHIAIINKTKDKCYINPGTLGCPGVSNKARCGILTIENEITNYEELEVEYDTKSAIDKIKELKYPLHKKILMLFYGVNEEINYILGETADVQNIETTEIPNVNLGKVHYNSDEIYAYVIEAKDKKRFKGRVFGAIILNDEQRLVVADKDAKLDYAEIKGYFKDIEEFQDAKFRCLYEKSAGAVIYKMVNNEPQFLIIYSKKDIAGFPKGHVEYGETEEQAALREIFEEVGINPELNTEFKESIFYNIDDTPINKEVVFFLAKISDDTEINIDENEVNKYEFMSFEQAEKVLRDNVKEVLRKALLVIS